VVALGDGVVLIMPYTFLALMLLKLTHPCDEGSLYEYETVLTQPTQVVVCDFVSIIFRSTKIMTLPIADP